MPDLTFVLRVTVPEHVDTGTLAEIADDAAPHDFTQADALSRWIGGRLDDAASSIAATLPDGWNVKVGGLVHASPSLTVSRRRYREQHDHRAAELTQRRDDDDRRAAEGDEQRDYAEERANRELLTDE
jgi:hypothetical protein